MGIFWRIGYNGDGIMDKDNKYFGYYNLIMDG